MPSIPLKLPVAVSAVAVVASLAVSQTSLSNPRDTLDAHARTRCATRLSIALVGMSPDAELLAADEPQTHIDRLLAQPEFTQRFARFINSQFNDEPGATAAEDAPYHIVRHVLDNARPWHEVFDGPYRVYGAEQSAGVEHDPDGLGYFRSPAWMRRYAGNEDDGYRIVAAYRMMNNIIGLETTATTNAPDVDTSAVGRQSQACRSCHYDEFYALDKAAKVLSRRIGENEDMSFVPPADGPQTFLDGREIADDAELVTALVESMDFKFRTCRLAFEFLYGRPEATCEAATFDNCIAAFEQTADIRDALRTVASTPEFCQ